MKHFFLIVLFVASVSRYTAVAQVDNWIYMTTIKDGSYETHFGESYNNKFYILGGVCPDGICTRVFVYNPLKPDTFEEETPMLLGVLGAKAAVIEDTLYVLGGAFFNYDIMGFETTAAIQAYDLVNKTWEYKAPLSLAVEGAICEVVNGKIYVIGGYDNNLQQQRLVQEYDPVLDTCIVLNDSMPTPRAGACHCTFENKIFAIGGDNGWDEVDNFEVFDPATSTWTIYDSMPFPRTNAGCETLGDRIYMIGGGLFPPYNDVWEYNIPENKWKRKLSSSRGRYAFASAVVNNEIYVTGGRTNEIFYNLRIDKYNNGILFPVDPPSSLEDSRAAGISLYPNPSDGEIIIDLTEATFPHNNLKLRVLSSAGQTILETVISDSKTMVTIPAAKGLVMALLFDEAGKLLSADKVLLRE